MLTRKQHELLMFIDKHLRTTGFSPSFDEMKTALDLRSKSGIHRLVSALEERGFIARRHHRARALEVLRMPGDPPVHRPEPPRNESAFAPNVIRGNFAGRLTGARAAAEAVAVQLPLYGRIAAGVPIEALADTTRHVDVPVSMIGNGEHFALEVDGESMIEAGIQDGDTVIIRRTENAESGDIVVALVDEADVTLKRLRRRGNSIALEPANPAFSTQIYPAEKVRVQGRLVALIREY